MVGVVKYLPRNSEKSRNSSWTWCRHQIAKASATDICILCANGWATFADPESPLFRTVESAHSLKVLMLDPKCAAVATRASSVQHDPKDYANEIRKSIRRLHELAAGNTAIELRLYQHVPRVKIISSTSFMWVQYYKNREHIDETPAYIFRNYPVSSSIFRMFSFQWQGYWLADETREVDLKVSWPEVKRLYLD